MSKIVFLDVDGTLIDYEAKLPASAAKAVDQARANGHKVYICTGPKARVYHKTDECRGLDRCSGDVESVSLEQAKGMGRRECRICYK
mgnify:CR=1 FL=1